MVFSLSLYQDCVPTYRNVYSIRNQSLIAALVTKKVTMGRNDANLIIFPYNSDNGMTTCLFKLLRSNPIPFLRIITNTGSEMVF
jgi:hypothetical protein